MKILVFGATGFIGRKLCTLLESRGHTVAKSDIRKDTNWQDQVAASEVVVNLAGAPIFGKRWDDHVKAEIHSSRVEGTEKIVDAIGKANEAGSKVAALINASAVGFYGPTFDEELTEDSPSGSDFLAFVCREWEEAAFAAQRRFGVRTVVVRTGIVLGRGGGALEKLLPPFKAFLGGPTASGKQWMSWIHLEDVVGIYLHAIEKTSVQGALNATAPHPLRNRDFAKSLGKVLHRPAFMPLPSLALYALVGEVAEILVNGERVFPKATLASGYQFKFPELEAALKNILRS